MRENGTNGLRSKVNKRLTEMKQAGEPIWFLKIVGNRFQRPGVPDFLVAWNGRMGAVELKQPGEHPTPTQRNELEWMGRVGIYARTARSMDDFEDFMRGLRQTTL